MTIGKTATATSSSSARGSTLTPRRRGTTPTRCRAASSQVWLKTRLNGGNDPVLEFEGDSDAHIVRGLVAIMLALFSGRRASEILRTDAEATMREFELDERLTPQRANGLRSMVKRIKREAQAALAPASPAIQ